MKRSGAALSDTIRSQAKRAKLSDTIAPVDLRKKTVFGQSTEDLDASFYEEEATQRIPEDLAILAEAASQAIPLNMDHIEDDDSYYKLSLPFLTEQLDPSTRIVATGALYDSYSKTHWFCLITDQTRKDKILALKCFKILSESERINLKARFAAAGSSK